MWSVSLLSKDIYSACSCFSLSNRCKYEKLNSSINKKYAWINNDWSITYKNVVQFCDIGADCAKEAQMDLGQYKNIEYAQIASG